MRSGKACPCVRDVPYRKCKRCQRLGKPCEKFPLRCVRRAAAWVATAPDQRDKAGYEDFIDELETLAKHFEQRGVMQTHLWRSLNHNVFRLIGVMSAVARWVIQAVTVLLQ